MNYIRERLLNKKSDHPKFGNYTQIGAGQGMFKIFVLGAELAHVMVRSPED